MLLVDLPLDTPNAALNVIISFLTIAQKRGAFTLQESAKLWECIKFFTGSVPTSQPKSADASESNVTLDVTEDGSAVVAPA